MRISIQALSRLTLLPIAISTALVAQDSPAWAVGLTSANPSGNEFQRGTGIEGSWTFLRNHWIKGRINISALHLDKGSGDIQTQDLYDTASNTWTTQTSWNFRSRAFVFSATCDWLVPLFSQHAPYLILGAGFQGVSGSTDIVERDYLPNGSFTESRRTESRSTGEPFELLIGFGYSFPWQIEVEVKAEAGLLSGIAEHFGSQTGPNYRNPPLLAFSVRKQF
jgi:hypothetical protein